MARTLKKMEMENILDFTSSLAQFSELENFAPFNALGVENSLFGSDDVYKELVDKAVTNDVGLAPDDISAGDLLDELDLKNGDGFGEAGWMTDKIDFAEFDAALLIPQNKEVTDLDSDLKLKTIDDSLAEIFVTASPENLLLSEVPVTNDQSCPSSPEQKVPDFLPQSPDSGVSSPMSVAIDDSSNSFASLDDSATIAELLLACGSSACVSNEIADSCTTSGVATNSSKTESVQSIVTVKKPQIPYSRSNITYTVKPKVKSPQQRMRKREQNKDAATRYRVKKRDEHNQLLSECEDLEKDNRQLKDQVGSLSKEIDYLKNLMLEVYKTRLQKQQLEVTD